MSKYDELPANIHDIIPSVVSVVLRRYRAYVERDDLIQESYAWAITRAEYLQEQMVEDNKQKLEQNERRIGYQIKRVCERYSRREKAAKSGYQVGDEAYYETYTIAQLLQYVIKCILTDTPFEQGQQIVDDGQPKRPSAPAESGNLIAMLIDIKKGYEKLDQDEKMILRQRYYDEFTLQQLADFWECAVSTADRRCEKALLKLQDNLGGQSPWS